ncbi:MAG: hypothetical protein CVU90_10065 [Firmicutes bacterium HGW-Firmicutes-15]|nr:MAG: hypothetical protein CVU90_10065 [Firmicutes bacterium HGW-Firmicutes-15]
MNLIDIYHSTGVLIKPLTIVEVLSTNKESQKYGLALTAAEAHELIESRNQAVRNHGRVELGIEVVKQIISAFYSSSYINREDYALTINELVEIFYYMKNETEESIGDDELISIMQEFYNTSCRGSLELLRDRELAILADSIRRARQEADYSLERKHDNEKYGY